MGFFVISGFVLRLSLEHGPRTAPAAAAKFVIARLFRFYPIVAVGVLLSAVVGSAAVASDGFTARHLAVNLLLLDVSMNAHLWALQVELLMMPVILALFFLERRWGPYVVLGVASAATMLAFIPHWALWRPLSINLFAFALGMTVPTLGRRFATALSRGAATRWIVVSAAVLLAAGPCLGAYSIFTTIIEAYVFAGALSLVAYRLDVPLLRWLDARWLRRLGSASGSYYVLHMATVPVALAAAKVIPAAWCAQAPGVVGVGAIAVWLVAIAPLMVGVSHLVEAPGVALGRRLARSLGLDSRARSRPNGAHAFERRAA
jgi:peptidoglycan/LPS O-acetylase OafA/YrhL